MIEIRNTIGNDDDSTTSVHASRHDDRRWSQ